MSELDMMWDEDMEELRDEILEMIDKIEQPYGKCDVTKLRHMIDNIFYKKGLRRKL